MCTSKARGKAGCRRGRSKGGANDADEGGASDADLAESAERGENGVSKSANVIDVVEQDDGDKVEGSAVQGEEGARLAGGSASGSAAAATATVERGDGKANKGKKQRGSEDAYMLIYVGRGVAWGPKSGGKDEPALPPHVLVSGLVVPYRSAFRGRP